MRYRNEHDLMRCDEVPPRYVLPPAAYDMSLAQCAPPAEYGTRRFLPLASLLYVPGQWQPRSGVPVRVLRVSA